MPVAAFVLVCRDGAAAASVLGVGVKASAALQALRMVGGVCECVERVQIVVDNSSAGSIGFGLFMAALLQKPVVSSSLWWSRAASNF